VTARPSRLLGVLVAVLLLPVTGAAAGSGAPGRDAAGATSLRVVAQVPYTGGSHLEHATIRGRDYLFAATQSRGAPADLRVIDVTRPTRPVVVAQLQCGAFQGHLQVSADTRTLVVGVDGPTEDPYCVRTRGEGFATIDISDPRRPRPVGFASIPGGSHSTATHPSAPLLYNAPEGSPVPDRTASPVVEVWSIKDPRRPVLAGSLPLPGVHSPHDISFSRDGRTAAVAAISAFHLLDTSNPLAPRLLATLQCPGCQHTHEARFTPDGRTLVVNDEALGGPYPCPGGFLYFYDVAGAKRSSPELVGSYTVGDAGVTSGAEAGFCTPHVFDLSADGTRLAASWHAAGVRLLDITEVRGHTVGTRASSGADAPRELAAHAPAGSDWFTAKLHRGPYVYAVDESGLTVLQAVRG
jgi:hypothetical protein